jgi:hypothetical protein
MDPHPFGVRSLWRGEISEKLASQVCFQIRVNPRPSMAIEVVPRWDGEDLMHWQLATDPH